jgi:hypothetical protein
VASASELLESQRNYLLFFKIIPSHFCRASEASKIKEWPGKMIYLNFDSIFGDFFLKFFEEEVSDYLS